MKSRLPVRQRPRALAEELERRILLSADLQSLLVDPDLAHEDAGEAPAAELEPLHGNTQAGEVGTFARRELVFVDPAVDGSERLLEDLERQAEAGANLDVVLLEPDRDGVAQITETLARFQQLDAIHFVSHGAEGALNLGNATLSADTLDLHADAVASWANALGSHADLLFYGCDLAAGERGAGFVNSLAELTDADIACSVDLTGGSATGGDWDLEHHAGSVETRVAFSAAAREGFTGTLAAPSVTVDALTSNDATPALSGTVDDAAATIDVTVAGNTYAATNNGDGTWTLADDTVLPALGNGVYDISVEATNVLSEVGTDGTTDELTIDTSMSGVLVVDTTSDVADGNTSSITALLAERGADGSISLREAILATANSPNAASPDEIRFNIAEPLIGGMHTITVSAGGLPTLDDAVVIDGTTEPDYGSAPVVRIDGVSAGGGVHGIHLASGSDGSAVHGLAIVRFSGSGIQIAAGANNVTIADSWIGSDGSGSAAMGNANDGIDVRGAMATIHGNVINNSGDEGINIQGAAAIGNVVTGNIIGLEADGSTGSGNSDVGVAILTGASGNRIGGPTAAERNVISMNYEGMEINSDDNVVQGNYIGTDAGGTLDRGNRSDDGIEIQSGASNNLIGGDTAGEGNRIAFNQLRGVTVKSGTNNVILGNTIHSNGQPGIDLGNDGVTGNDAGTPPDTDSGANDLQNFPVLTNAVSNGSDAIRLTGTLDTTPGSDFRIEFFSSATPDGSGHGEAERFLGFVDVTTDASGAASFDALLSATVAAGEFVTATATADLGGSYGSTSEFAANLAAAVGVAPIAADDPGDLHTLIGSLAPTGHWTLGEPGGSTAADAASGNDATIQGATPGMPGAVGGDTALVFDGSSDYVEIPHDDGYLLDDGTIQLWFNANDTTRGHLFSKDAMTFLSGGHLSIYLNASGHVEVRLQSEADSYYIESGPGQPISAGQWHHVAFSFGSGGMKLYVDGSLAASDPYTGGLGSTSGGAGNFEPIGIGTSTQRSDPGIVDPLEDYFDGTLDEVAIFDRALPDATIRSLAVSTPAYSVLEDSALDVAAVDGVLANDFDGDGDLLTAVLVTGPANAAAFTLNPDGSFHYTPRADFAGTDTFTYRANDGTSDSNLATASITVNPVDDAPVVDDQTLGPLDEHSADGSVVGTVVASDVDAGQTLHYAITAGNTGGAFAIDPYTGELTVANASALDFEGTPRFDLTVEVTDDGTPALFDSATVTIALNDLDEAPAIADAAFAVDEGAADGTLVGTVPVLQPDANDTYTYSITAGDPGGTFGIDDAGAIRVADGSQLDFESQSAYTLTVRVLDDDGSSSTAAVAIDLNDVDESPVIDDARFTVAENAADGTPVGSVPVVQPDARDSYSYAIIDGDPAGAFAIDDAGSIAVADGAQLDFERQSAYTLTVRVLDDDGNADTATVVIDLGDLDESPVIADATFSLDENSADGTWIGSVPLVDPDAGDAHSYSITAGDPNGAFAIDDMGTLTVADGSQLSFESQAVYTLTIQVLDAAGSPGLASVTIQLGDLDETPAIVDATFGIDERVTNGSRVGSVPVLEPDANDTYTYAITSGDPGAAFAIDDSGSLTVADRSQLDFDTLGTHSLIVQVTDDDGELDTANISIDLRATPSPSPTLPPLVVGPDTDDAPATVANTPDQPTSDATVVTDPEPEAERQDVGVIPEAFAVLADPAHPDVSRFESVEVDTTASDGAGIVAQALNEDLHAATERDDLRDRGEMTVEREHRTLFGGERMARALDRVRTEMTDSATEEASERQVVTSAAEGAALAISLSWLALLLRGGSLAAVALSALPLWRGMDPLAVLAVSDEERERLEEDLRKAREQEDVKERELGKLLDRR